MAIVFMFPGQNSRYPGMLAKFSALHGDNAALLERASDALGRNLHEHFRVDNALQFARNRDVQVGVFLASHMLLRSLEREGVSAGWSLGLSLGEYNHLVHIGALRFEDALRLLQQRGDAYDETPHGAMASLFPIELGALETVLASHAAPGVCSVALHNSPRQQVLAGDRDSIQQIIEVLEEDFVEHTWIEQRLAMHSGMMMGAAWRFREALEEIVWAEPQLPYFPNTLGRHFPHPVRDDFIDLLARHIHRPVLWRESLELVTSTAPDAVLVEVGPKGILLAMAGRRWLACPLRKTDTEDNFQAHFEGLVQELTFGKRESAIAHSQR